MEKLNYLVKKLLKKILKKKLIMEFLDILMLWEQVNQVKLA